ncbi:hypothetical protein PV08_11188 [Exophiala spinifera]|uniref:Xylanolytic transcriptional activator regulatory domain-containing protein n=1 Tax=Exophiala spinifera TaxID=91928 RepID=A0A0D1ZB31_9EURO|nr:uncharacterized protein PV08_11188 [Exophiala spinifera]KIW10227.1 hypothetical protein PV08_11188 [Exophiala spinifera]
MSVRGVERPSLTWQRRTEALYQENVNLKQQLGASRSPPESVIDQNAREDTLEPAANPLSNPAMSTSNSVLNNGGSDSASLLPRPLTAEADVNFPPSWNQPFAQASTRQSPNPTATVSRSLAGMTVEADEIDEIFRLYFAHYHSHLPFLDPNISPNSYYDQSSLIFWAIIGVGVRRYTANPTLFGSLAEPILHLPWPPLHPTPAVIPAIQGLLLLSSFPFPTDSTSKDTSYTLSGMAINLALQIGLHVPTFSQDYSRSKMTLTQQDIQRRLQLWFHCIVVHQKAACGLGYPIMVSPDQLQRSMDPRGLTDSMTPLLLLEMRLASLLSRINTLFSPSMFRVEDAQDKHSRFAREMMSDTFENQLDELESERKLSELEKLYINITRLQIRVHCLQDRENPATSVKVTQLGLCATSIIESIERLEVEMSLIQHCPHYIFRIAALAASVLLRLSKQSRPPPPTSTSRKTSIGGVNGISGGSDDYNNNDSANRQQYARQQYKTYFFQTISLLRKMSVESNDMPSRMAKIFSQLWSIDKIFEQTNTVNAAAAAAATTSSSTGAVVVDGVSPGDESGSSSASSLSAASPLIVQSRLSMSVLHDAMWRWKDRFKWAGQKQHQNQNQNRHHHDSNQHQHYHQQQQHHHQGRQSSRGMAIAQENHAHHDRRSSMAATPSMTTNNTSANANMAASPPTSENQFPRPLSTIPPASSSSVTGGYVGTPAYNFPAVNMTPDVGTDGSLNGGGGGGGSGGMMMSFVDGFSPLGSLPWESATNQDFEMMIHRFPESWPV